MRRITINGKEYTIEFSIAASLYNEGTEEILNGFVEGGLIESETKDGQVDNALKRVVSTMANVPHKAITLFYTGLIEHHGADGDRTIQSQNDAKNLIADYIKESGKSFYDVLTEMIEVIEEDHFFEMIGLDKVMENLDEPKKSRRSSKGGATSSKNI